MRPLTGSPQRQNTTNAFLFLAFSIGGGMAIFFLKNYIDRPDLADRHQGWGTVTIVVFPIALMTLYAIIASLPGFRLRIDQTGDNLYYLGFIYTLCSLSVALWTVAQGAEAIEILHAFGIAITSTLYGITLRVFFNQMRVDPHDVERASRLELSEATNRVRRELDDTIIQLEDFRRSAVQAMSEGFEETQRAVDKITQRILSSYDEIADDGSKAVKQAANELTAAVDKVNSQVQKLGGQMETITVAHAAFADTSKDVRFALEAISTMQREAAETDRLLRTELSLLAKELKENLQSQRADAENSLVGIRKLSDLLREYNEISRESQKRTRTGLEQLLSEVAHSTRKQTTELSKLLEELTASAGEERQLRSELKQFITDLKDKLEEQNSGIETSLSDVRSLHEGVVETLQQTRDINVEIKENLNELNKSTMSHVELFHTIKEARQRLSQIEKKTGSPVDNIGSSDVAMSQPSIWSRIRNRFR